MKFLQAGPTTTYNISMDLTLIQLIEDSDNGPIDNQDFNEYAENMGR